MHQDTHQDTLIVETNIVAIQLTVIFLQHKRILFFYIVDVTDIFYMGLCVCVCCMMRSLYFSFLFLFKSPIFFPCVGFQSNYPGLVNLPTFSFLPLISAWSLGVSYVLSLSVFLRLFPKSLTSDTGLFIAYLFIVCSQYEAE